MNSFWILIYLMHPITTIKTFQSEKSCIDAKAAIVAAFAAVNENKTIANRFSCIKANP